MGRRSGLGRAWERWQERVECGKACFRDRMLRRSFIQSVPASDWKVELGEQKQNVKVK